MRKSLMPRLNKKKNIYNLSPKLDNKHSSRVVTIEIDYFVPEDEMHAHVALRKDVTDPALLVRLFRAVEKSMRTISPEYDQDIDLLEAVAKAYLVDGETDGSGQEQSNGEQPRGCRCK
jgi:hypothetical protein